MLRRLTALLISLVLVSSTILGAAMGCATGDSESATSAHHGAHHSDALAPSHVVSHQAETDDRPVSLPHAPTACTAVTACGIAVVVTQTLQLGTSPHVPGRVAGAAALAPDSPALGLEPPPPRG